MFVRNVLLGGGIGLNREKALFSGGKLTWRTLSKLLSYLPLNDPDLIMGPGIGEDAAIIRFKDGLLVVHVDPITTATRRIGWLSIHIAANDVAVRGAKPRWFLTTILLPIGYLLESVEEIFKDIGDAARSLNAVIIGGHTEYTPGIPRPLIITTAIGYSSDRVILTKNAQPGDKIIVIGRVGGEGAAILAWDHSDLLRSKGVSGETIGEARKYLFDISVVDKALSIKEYANSMHDPTEGGILQGIRELAIASNTEVVIYADKITIDRNVEEITKALGLNPLRILSSGALIASIPMEKLDNALKVLDERGYNYSVIGEIIGYREGGRVILKWRDREEVIDEDVIDEIYKITK
jgi:hydrogenase expression/formation protein HypE